MSQRCNGIPDCKGNFDETNCNMILIDQQLYQKEIPPLIKYKHKINIKVSVSILAIEGFNEIDMTYRIKFSFMLMWYVIFQNMHSTMFVQICFLKYSEHCLLGSWIMVSIS
jgi:hypothetical protein